MGAKVRKLLVVSMLLTPLPLCAQDAVQGTWRTLAGGRPNQINVNDAATCADSSYAYIFAGSHLNYQESYTETYYDGYYEERYDEEGGYYYEEYVEYEYTETYYTNYYNAARRLDPVTNAWTVLANVPGQAGTGGTAVHFNGKAYLFGIQYNTNLAMVYTIATNSWTTVGLPATFGAGASAARVADRIIVTGGSGTTNRVYEFNPATNQSTALPAMRTPRRLHASAYVVGLNRLFLIGGYNASNQLTDAVEEYDPDKKVWKDTGRVLLDDVASPRAWLKAVSLSDGRILLPGGYKSTGAVKEVLEFHAYLGTWTRRADLAFVRSQHGVVGPIGGKVLAIGSSSYPSSVEEFTPANLGSRPVLGALATQAGPFGVIPGGGWTGNSITMSAPVSDIDIVATAPQTVRLDVEVRTLGGNWADGTRTLGNLVGQGNASVVATIAMPGPYQWRMRAWDSHGNAEPVVNGIPGWVEFLGDTPDADFISDHAAPGAPVPASPLDTDVSVTSTGGGLVEFSWIAPTDNGPALTYNIEIAGDTLFTTIEAGASGLSAAATMLHLVPSRFDRVWRVQAVDLGGNASPWSAPMPFRVVFDDQKDHAAKDAVRVCGFGATPTPAWSLLVLVAALALRRK